MSKCYNPNNIIYLIPKKSLFLTFRYTQNQRKLETRNKKYNKLQDKINKETKINNKSIKEIETELSKYNSKTVDFNKFIEYFKKEK